VDDLDRDSRSDLSNDSEILPGFEKEYHAPWPKRATKRKAINGNSSTKKFDDIMNQEEIVSGKKVKYKKVGNFGRTNELNDSDNFEESGKVVRAVPKSSQTVKKTSRKLGRKY